ncbi:MAG: hypothetical protein KKF98_16900 [Bacteroidetes bacterium]|uniref:Uncharacterized protein n=2 Tax=viral metagenome TaxID=1070528 RepID=A0A6H1Z9C0_9ZZZZ|nr:hypothetical protein [Bacteroidota bacterium]
MVYDSTKPVTGGSLVAVDMRENFRALKEDNIVGGVAALGIVEGMLAASAVAQAKLKTSQGSVSGISAIWVSLTLPGGEYGFREQLKGGTVGNYYQASLLDPTADDGLTTSYATIISYRTSGGATFYAQQRYVTASGEVHWVFVLRDKITKDIISMWQAPDHPCFGNGGKPLLTPYPFLNYDSNSCEIIVINPSKEQILEMQQKTIKLSETEPDRCLLQVITEDYIIDETTKPSWPDIPVTVGLPPDWNEAWLSLTPVQPIKKMIPKPDKIIVASLKLKKIA